jgi:hypothetical protein
MNDSIRYGGSPLKIGLPTPEADTGGAGGSPLRGGMRFGRPLVIGLPSPVAGPRDPVLALDSSEYQPPELIVHLRDADAIRQAQIDDYVSLQLNLKHQDVGAWLLTLHPDSPGFTAFLDAINAGGGVGEIGHTGIEVTRGGTVIFSGPVATIDRARKGNADVVTLSGPDDSVWLARRLAMPEPATAAPPYASDAYDVRSGAASTVMFGYVDANAGPGALAARQVAGLVLAPDLAVGADLPNQQARLQTLLELLQGIALAGGDLGFGILSDGAGSLVFSVYEPSDRTAEVIFSDGIGNLGDYEYEVTAPSGDYVVVGGGGELTARTFLEQGDTAGIARWGRVEFFRDRRDTTDLTEMAQTAGEELAAKGENVAVTIAVRDTPQIAYGVNYTLGDRVTCVVDGLQITEVVREAKITKNINGEVIEPTLATPGATRPGLPQLFAGRRTDRTRIGNLERR